MDVFYGNVRHFFSVLISYVSSLCRLSVWTVLVFLLGLQKILFTRYEVSSVKLCLIPKVHERRSDKEYLSFVDRLCEENPDLLWNSDDEDSLPEEKNKENLDGD